MLSIQDLNAPRSGEQCRLDDMVEDRRHGEVWPRHTMGRLAPIYHFKVYRVAMIHGYCWDFDLGRVRVIPIQIYYRHIDLKERMVPSIQASKRSYFDWDPVDGTT